MAETLTRTRMYVRASIQSFLLLNMSVSIQWIKDVLAMTTGTCFQWMSANPFMRSHGLIGRSYAGKVKQIITGSVGFDDYEWGVTLFSDDVLQFKNWFTKCDLMK